MNDGMTCKRSIMIVGNGEIDEAARLHIAKADIVVRFNDCRTYGSDARTDIVAVCNSGRPAKTMLNSNVWRHHPCVMQAHTIMGVRSPRLLMGIRNGVVAADPSLSDFCDDYTDELREFCAAHGKSFQLISPEIHAMTEGHLAPHVRQPYIVPSSGMVVIEYFLRTAADAQITIAGFSHTGWEGHPFAAEKCLVGDYVATGLLQRGDQRAAPPCPLLQAS
ncbi:hypothetical protein EV217_5117 [Phyllobacterium myrsinacearum]|nr:hypothetical protein EV217_5117 [Phyllobacterium myrsinacearum]